MDIIRTSRSAIADSILGLALVTALAGTGLPAQSGQVRFVNHSPYARTEWGTATVPFAQGTYQVGDEWSVAGVPSEVVPFGARWPDGSIRYAQVAVPLSLNPGEERLVTVERRPAMPHAFQSSTWTSYSMQRMTIAVVVVLVTVSFVEYARARQHGMRVVHLPFNLLVMLLGCAPH